MILWKMQLLFERDVLVTVMTGETYRLRSASLLWVNEVTMIAGPLHEVRKPAEGATVMDEDKPTTAMIPFSSVTSMEGDAMEQVTKHWRQSS
jgi:hypothetical protein